MELDQFLFYILTTKKLYLSKQKYKFVQLNQYLSMETH